MLYQTLDLDVAIPGLLEPSFETHDITISSLQTELLQRKNASLLLQNLQTKKQTLQLKCEDELRKGREMDAQIEAFLAGSLPIQSFFGILPVPVDAIIED